MLIQYKNADIYQETQLVLHDVTFSVDEGEFVYVTGKVGSGKSTLFKTLYGELKVAEGEAQVMEFNLRKLRQKHLPRLRRKLGVVFQDFQLLTDRTVFENLRFVLRATGWKRKREISDRIAEVLQLVGMETKGYKRPNELSGGEQQRISIARAILNNPRIILADEPTGNLDKETGRAITRLLQDLSRAGSTIIMITHDVDLLKEFPGRVFHCESHTFNEISHHDAIKVEEKDIAEEKAREEAEERAHNQ